VSASGIFAEAQSTLVASLEALDLAVVTDSRNARPLSVLVDPPTFTCINSNVAEIEFSVKVLAAPPGNQDAVDYLVTVADSIMDSPISVIRGMPGFLNIGGQEVPTYDLTIRVGTQRS
jgi:hypothetical protein